MSNQSPLCPVCNSTTKLKFDRLYDDRYGYEGVYDLYQCTSCQHSFLKVHFTDAELQHLYSNFYPRSSFELENYQPVAYTDDFKSWFNGEKRAFSMVPRGVKVLDIGCGFGEALGYHKGRGCDVYGIEADQNILRVGEKFGFNVKVGVFQGGLYEDNSFDYVTLDQVLEHSQDPESVLKAISSVLRKDGRLVLTIPNATGWGARFFGRLWIHWHAPYHVNFFSRNSIRKMAAKANLEVESIETVTSSEWLYYQRIHNIAFPEKAGEPSYFWSPKRNWSDLSEEVMKKRSVIDRLHKKKFNHIITRFFDMVGMGDNFLVVLRKTSR